MPVFTQAEQDQIMSVSFFTALDGQKIKMILVFLRRDLWVDLTTHPGDRSFGNCRWNKKIFARHPVITLLVFRRNTALIAKREKDSFPWKITTDSRDFAVNGAWGISSG